MLRKFGINFPVPESWCENSLSNFLSEGMDETILLGTVSSVINMKQELITKDWHSKYGKYMVQRWWLKRKSEQPLHSAQLLWRGGVLGVRPAWPLCLVEMGNQPALINRTDLQFLCPAHKAFCDLSFLSSTIKMETWDPAAGKWSSDFFRLLRVRLEEWAGVHAKSWCDPYVSCGSFEGRGIRVNSKILPS